ncbi:MAG: cell division protein ZapA [Muribaculaceae bacterium]
MSRTQKITIKIADVAPMSMTVPADGEALVREAEFNVNKLIEGWAATFPDKTKKELLAMAAYQFAKVYYDLLHQTEEQVRLMTDFEAELDRLLDIENLPQ